MNLPTDPTAPGGRQLSARLMLALLAVSCGIALVNRLGRRAASTSTIPITGDNP